MLVRVRLREQARTKPGINKPTMMVEVLIYEPSDRGSIPLISRVSFFDVNVKKVTKTVLYDNFARSFSEMVV